MLENDKCKIGKNLFNECMTRSQVLGWSQVGTKLFKLRNCGGLGARSQLSTLKGVEGHAEASRLD